MDKFKTDKVKRIEFDDGEYVDLTASLSWGDLEGFRSGEEEEGGTIRMMLFFIKEWNFKRDGKVVEVNEESLKGLDHLVFAEIDTAISEIIKGPGKKKPGKE